MARMSKIPEGAVIATIMGAGTQQCLPINGEPCDSWKTFAIGVFRVTTDNEYVPMVHPLCQRHLHAYIDHVLFSPDTDWGNAADEEEMEE